ncbi:MAG: nucleotidyl transferase AbiEii/AbiGii toxin family protein [Thermoplasmatota archaeon]
MFDETGYDQKTLEKVYRICDILKRISSVDYTKERLSLYGGTSLNFLHLKDISRLSLDIDFNYRGQGKEDWWKERDKIDDIIKRILYDLDYEESEIKIQATHPLTRFTVHYRTEEDQRDSIKIEMGYMRRIPVFKEDDIKTYHHFKTGEEIGLKTPFSEEIFGNKFCTLIYRYKDDTIISSRDLFDVYNIAHQTFDEEMFLTALIIDSMMRPEPRIYEQKIDNILDHVSIDEQLLNLLRTRNIPNDLRSYSHTFIEKYVSLTEERYQGLIDAFFDEYRFEPELFDNHDELNPSLDEHPSIMWNLKKLKEDR